MKWFAVLGVGVMLALATLPASTPASASLPDPNLLVSQARATLLQQYHTFYLQDRSHAFVAATTSERSTTDGPVLLAPFAVRLHTQGSIVTQLTPSSRDRYDLGHDLIQIRNLAWTRSAASQGHWRVTAPQSEEELAPLPGDLLSPSTLAEGVGITHLETVGEDTFGGVSVWHVRGTLVLRLSGGRLVDGHIAYLIGVSDHLPYLETGWYREASGQHDFGRRIVLSRFGVRVNIFPPSLLPLP
jgi:hypothetical protein